MKKVAYLLLCIAVFSALLPVSASADCGPKPSTVVDFTGLNGEACYATLLSKTYSAGPNSSIVDGNMANAYYQQGDALYDIFLKFAEYEDADGFFFNQFIDDCTQTHQLIWGYFPPEEFKILLYFPDTDTFLVSPESYKRYAFDSYFTVDVSGNDLSAASQEDAEIAAVRSYDYSSEILSLMARVLLTIAIELAIALLFGFREKKLIQFIAVVNVITQIALNLALNIINFKMGQWAFSFFYILLEFVVTVVELILYSSYLKKYSKGTVSSWKPSVYALTANTASFILGLGLAYWIPGIF